MTEHASIARQGHKYLLGTQEVLSMGTGHVVTVRPIDQSEPYPLGTSITVKASWLKPVPMVYHGGEVPK